MCPPGLILHCQKARLHGEGRPRCCRGALISGHAGRGHVGLGTMLSQPAPVSSVPKASLAGWNEGAGTVACSTLTGLSPAMAVGCPAGLHSHAVPTWALGAPCLLPSISAPTFFWGPGENMRRGDPRARSPEPTLSPNSARLGTGQPQPPVLQLVWPSGTPHTPLDGHFPQCPRRLPPPLPSVLLAGVSRLAAPWCSLLPLLRLSDSLLLPPGPASPAPPRGDLRDLFPMLAWALGLSVRLLFCRGLAVHRSVVERPVWVGGAWPCALSLVLGFFCTL